MSSLMDAARSGMIEHERNIERISHNIANVNTSGYKRLVVRFSDVFDTQQFLDLVTGAPPPPEEQTSSAVVGSAEMRDFSSGTLLVGDRPFDLAIEGEGFLQVELPDGQLALTRAGALFQDREGSLITVNGYRLVPGVAVQLGYTDVIVQPNGIVTAVEPDGETRVEVGAIQLARVANPTGLESIGESLYAPTVASGEPELGTPGEDGFGTLRSGLIEGSNVELTEEMSNLIVAQRSYQMNAALYRYADQMYELANDLTT